MNLIRCLKWIGLMTMLALSYLYIQMQIFDLAYQRSEKENEMKRLTEIKENTSYAISALKSSKYLGGKMLVKGSQMQFRDDSDVVKLTTPQEFSVQKDHWVKQEKSKQKSNLFLSLLSLGAPAEARTQQ